jgi:HK97 family phage portal protein
MSFSNLVRRLAGHKPERKAGKGSRFLEIVTANDDYTAPPPRAADLLKLYNEHLWVRAIVGKIGKRAAAQKWYLEKPDGTRVDKHPLLDFLKKGTKRLPGRLGVQVTVTHKDLAGEAFWAIGLDRSGVPVEFAPIPPHWVTNIPASDDPGEVFEVQPKVGTLYRIPANQIIHFRDPDPLDPYGRGSSNAHAARVQLDTDQNAAKYLAAFFKNSARPDLIVSGSKDAPISDRDRPRLEEHWNNRYRGVANAFRPFFSSQPIDVKELTRSLRDNSIAEISQEGKATIAEFYGVPPEILGRLENSNRATIDAADHLLGKHVIDPRLADLLDVLGPWATEAFGLDGLELRYETPIQEDLVFKLSVMTARPGAYADNDFRKLTGDKPWPGEEFDKPRPDPLAANDDGGDDPDGEGGPGGKKPKPKPGDDAKTGKATRGNDVAPRGNSPSAERKTLSPEEIIRVSDAHADPSVVAEATRIMDAIFLKLLETYGEDLLGVLETEVRFQVTSAVANWLDGRGSRLISGIDDTTRKALRASLVEGAAANESLAALSDRIEQIFEDAASTRAPIIGQTEATAVTGFGSHEAARQAGFDAKKWLASGDQAVRTTHQALHGQIKRLSEKFRSPSGAEADHPGDFGVTSEDIHCRCAMRPVLTGELQRAANLTDTAFEAAWGGMHARIAGAIEAEARKIFAGQKAVALAMLNRMRPAHG